MPGFFIGWVTVGVAMALVLVIRGHDARITVALGVGLGPLMAIVMSDTIRRREPTASPLVFEPGVDRGGPLDVMVLVQGDPEDVRSVLPTLEAVRSELGVPTLARAGAYEWVEGDRDNDVVTARPSALVDAADRLPVAGAELALWPGPVGVAVERFRRLHQRALVLLEIAEPSVGTAVSG